MKKSAMRYAWRIVRETKRKKPMTETELTEAKKQCAVNDINEIMRSRE